MVRWGFRLLLGLELEDEAAIAILIGSFPTLGALHVGLTLSEEFVQIFRSRHRTPSLGAGEQALLGRLAIDPGPAEPGFFKDFLGLRTRLGYLPPGHDWLEGAVFQAPAEGMPHFHDAEEWGALLRAAAQAEPHGHFAVMELGAGWGPWVAAAGRLAGAMGMKPSLTAVEADASHLGYLRQHFADNALDLADCRIIHGIVGASDGQAWFPVMAADARHYGLEASFAPTETAMHALPCHSLATLLAGGAVQDLLHVDIQGAEAQALPPALPALNAKVRRLLVGTHGRAIEETLLQCFNAAGWVLEDDKACGFTTGAAPAELLADGLQVWRNPAL